MNKYRQSCILIIFLIYLTAISNAEPIIISVSPEDGARLDSNPLLIVNVSNYRSIDIVWYFKEAESSEWEKIGTNLSVVSGVYTQEIPNGTEEGTNYQWKVNISDINSSIEKTFGFRRRGWQVIQEIDFGGVLFGYCPDSIRNLSVFNMDEQGNFRINFDMKFYNYTGPISMEVPGRLCNITFYSSEEGIYENVVIDLPKENQILFPPGFKNRIKLFRPDGLRLNNTGYSDSFVYDKWKINVVGDEEYLDFEILYQTNIAELTIFVVFLLITILLNLISWFKKSGQEFAIGSTLIILPSIFFPLLLEVPLLSYEMIVIVILSIIGFLISFSNWRCLKKLKKAINEKDCKKKTKK